MSCSAEHLTLTLDGPAVLFTALVAARNAGETFGTRAKHALLVSWKLAPPVLDADLVACAIAPMQGGHRQRLTRSQIELRCLTRARLSKAENEASLSMYCQREYRQRARVRGVQALTFCFAESVFS